MFRAVFDFVPTLAEESENCIYLDEGQTLTKVKDIGDGWSAGYNVHTDETGIFPSSFVELMDYGDDLTVKHDIGGRSVGVCTARDHDEPRVDLQDEAIPNEWQSADTERSMFCALYIILYLIISLF